MHTPLVLVETQTSCRVGGGARGEPGLSGHPGGQEDAGADRCHLVLARDGKHLASSFFQAGQDGLALENLFDEGGGRTHLAVGGEAQLVADKAVPTTPVSD